MRRLVSGKIVREGGQVFFKRGVLGAAEAARPQNHNRFEHDLIFSG